MSEHIPTFADLCSAIADGQIPADSDGQVYQITALELRRFLNAFRSPSSIANPQDSSARSVANLRSLFTKHSVA